MATTPVSTVDATGIHMPAYADVLAYFQSAYRAIYGDDVYLGADSQDGEFLAILALAVSDVSALSVAVYNSFAPSTARGIGLSRVVKTNGIQRKVPTNSQVDLVLVGQVGTVITNGVATDSAGNKWVLPTPVVIPVEGQVTVTAICSVAGAVEALPNSVTTIFTATNGWQSVNNPLAAVQGAEVESDVALRARQTVSTAIPSLTILDGSVGAVASVAGVTRYAVYENDSDIPDTNGIPPHSISFVVEGGDSQTIASAIYAKKGLGPSTYGTTTETVVDSFGIGHALNFYRPTIVPVTYAITLKALRGFTTGIREQVRQAIVDWTNSLAIGDSVRLTRVYVPANLSNGPNSDTFEVMALAVGRDGDTPSTNDVAILFNEAVVTTLASVTVTVI